MQQNVLMKLRSLVVLGLVLSWPLPAWSAQLLPTLKQSRVGVVIRDLQLPQTFRSDLGSGLTTRILVQVALLQQGRPLEHRAVEITVKYDLWDETFGVTMTLDKVPLPSGTYPRVDDVIAVLSNLKLPDLFAASRLAGPEEFTLAVQVLFNPIERERMEEIRKWVAENSRLTPTDSANVGGSSTPAPSSDSRELFNRIFAQYSAGAAVAAAFTDSAASTPFKLESLRDEK